MASQERVHRDVPLAAKLHPVRAVPPVAVEMAVRESRDLGKGAEDILEYHEEDEQQGQHEGE